jgi:hypothetical protein
VYVKNTTKGTSANSEGGYTLNLKPGQYDVQYRAMGYKQESRKVDLKANQSIDIVLKGEDYQLKEVSIRAGAEDPAYAIIRKAIKKRKTYLNEVDAYTCEVYIKGLQKLLAAPKKFLGVDVQKMARENGLDSNRRGIVYLSESQSKYSFMRPDKVHEELISSKVSGSNRAFSFNRASDLQVNFYENLQVWEGTEQPPADITLLPITPYHTINTNTPAPLSRTAKPSIRSRLFRAAIMTHVLAATSIYSKIAGVYRAWVYISPKRLISTL